MTVMPVGNLHCSDRVETLLEWFIEVVDRPVASPLRLIYVVVPHLLLSEWLKRELVIRKGIFGGCRFVYPRQFMWEVVRVLAPDVADRFKYTREALEFAILKVLPEVGLDGRDGQPEVLKEPGGDPLISFQFAAVVADLLDQYTIYRPEIVESWETAPDNWQARIWKAALKSLDSLTPADLWKVLAERLRHECDETRSLPERVLVFGFSALPPKYLEFLDQLAKYVDVHLFVSLPGAGLWSAIHKLVPSLNGYSLPDPDTFYGLVLDTLRDLSRYPHGFLRTTVQLGSEFAFLVSRNLGHWTRREKFATGESGTLLQHVQRALRELDTYSEPENFGLDDTIQIHVCHTRLREVEVLRDHIIKWLEEDPALQLHEIGVFAPDITAYQPYIEAVFGVQTETTPRIPFQLVGRGVDQGDPVVFAVRSLLQLLSGRVTGVELLTLLGCQSVRQKFKFTVGELNTIIRWIARANIRWGLDEDQRGEIRTVPQPQNTWRAGLDRLLLGYSVGSGEPFCGLSPVGPVQGDHVDLLDRFLQFFGVVENILRSVKPSMTVREWCTVLRKAVEELVEDPDPMCTGTRRILDLIQEIQTDSEAAGLDTPQPLPILREKTLQLLSEAQETRIGDPAGVIFGSLMATHTVPFKVVCIIGLNYGEFPRRDSVFTFDLLRRQPRVGDRSVSKEDKYVFLQAILNARQRLYLSYVGKSMRDNADIMPSPILSHFMEFLSDRFKISPDSITTRHRLHGFDPVYYSRGNSKFFSYSLSNYEAAKSRPTGETCNVGRSIDGLPIRGSRLVTVEELVDFFRNPARAFLQSTLGIRLPPKPSQLQESECFWPDSLTRYQIRAVVLEKGLKGEPPESILESVIASGMLPGTEAGRTAVINEIHSMSRLVDHIRSLEPNEWKITKRPVDLEVNDWRISGELGPFLRDELVIYRSGKVRGVDRLEGWIKHLLALIAVSESTVTRVFGIKGGEIDAVSFQPCHEAMDVLGRLLDIYAVGARRLIPFFPETALAFAEKYLSTDNESEASYEAACQAALEKWLGNDFVPGECEDEYFGFCFPDFKLPDEEFERLALEVYGPLLKHVKGRDGGN